MLLRSKLFHNLYLKSLILNKFRERGGGREGGREGEERWEKWMIPAEDERCGNILLISLSWVVYIRAHILLSTYARLSNRDPWNKSTYVQSYKWLRDRKCNMFPLSAKMYAPSIRCRWFILHRTVISSRFACFRRKIYKNRSAHRYRAYNASNISEKRSFPLK